MRGQDLPNTRKPFFFFAICKVKHIQFHLNEVEKYIFHEYRRAPFSLGFLNSYAARESNRFQPKREPSSLLWRVYPDTSHSIVWLDFDPRWRAPGIPTVSYFQSTHGPEQVNLFSFPIFILIETMQNTVPRDNW